MKHLEKKDRKDPVTAWRRGLEGLGGEMGLAGLARHAYALAEIINSQVLAEVDQKGTKISCRKGCGACCRQVVPLSPPEAFLLLETMDGMERLSRDALLIRMADSGQKLEHEDFGKKPLFNYTKEYFQLGLPCPFLVEEACSIHPQRPLACREHIVVSPEENCADFPSPFIQLAYMPVSVGHALGSVAAELTGTGYEMIPMVRAFEWVAENKELGNRQWDAQYLFDRLAALCVP